ncbi:MAG: hypothetical protein A3I32_01970 [Candidatus Yanofskybacteria bacterium RIFCSPLOWO2_02_FULL_45_10]|uniref:Uncharacterized protein n=2 Tax=Candidatus Yanofskyibacteriota TaxID=1752733 RepID=A0A1F8G6I3_9BACT|nr:MAG: hypothetical protein A3F25_01300 [Candidatus Yanofskybacteria bacterium RIFCSPHIGHO2_12_FULL_45_19b]OGN31817.1 MAG: hypothetical protein A3I32_01970 [Candidatus Yanofskybacteria bacterium RIFCSPLOWO2_02_FULL_45_10]
MNNKQLSDREINLIDHVRTEINVVLYKDFTQSTAEKIYELLKILLDKKSDEGICPECRRKK